MARVKRGTITQKRHRKVLKQAKGYYGRKSTNFKMAKQAVMKSGAYAFKDRRLKKREFRQLWIARINAAARLEGLSYNQLIHGLKEMEIDLNRKVLAEMAVNDKAAFTLLCDQVKARLA